MVVTTGKVATAEVSTGLRYTVLRPSCLAGRRRVSTHLGLSANARRSIFASMAIAVQEKEPSCQFPPNLESNQGAEAGSAASSTPLLLENGGLNQHV